MNSVNHFFLYKIQSNQNKNEENGAICKLYLTIYKKNKPLDKIKK